MTSPRKFPMRHLRHLRLVFLVVSLSGLLSACGFMTPAQQYAGDQKAVSEIAVIQGYSGRLLGEDYHATISGFAYKSEPGPSVVKRFGWPGFTDYPREIQLDPGNYVLELYCFKSLTKPTFRPTLALSAKAGHAYTVKCDASQGKASLFVSEETRLP